MDQLKKYSPIFNHLNDSIAFVVHLSFLSNDCKLIGLNESQFLLDLGSIPQGWNKTSDIYQFRYVRNTDLNKNNNNNNNNEEKKNDDKKEKLPTLLVKILSLDQNQILISAVKQNDDNVYTLDICISDHINVKNKNLSDYNTIFKNINALLLLINEQITQKMIPPKKKENVNNNNNKKKDNNNNNNNNPLYVPPQPNPNNNPLLIGKGGYGGVPFGGGFGGDLDPLSGGGGNLMGQNHPRFGHHGPPRNPGNRPPFVPDNARFDPFGFGGGQPDPNHFKPPNQGGGRGGFGGFGGFM